MNSEQNPVVTIDGNVDNVESNTQTKLMAAVVDRPMSAFDDPAPPRPTRPPSSTEVIDVDLLEDPTEPQFGTQFSGQHAGASPDLISLVDSEDEQPASTASSAATSSSTRHHHGRRFFSPPPPAQSSAIPPVPRLPPLYANRTSLPMRRNPPAFPTLPVRPMTQPFAFERNLRSNPTAGPSNSQHPVDRNVSPLHAAPPSHHVPALGFGGAMISLNRARAEARAEQRRQNIQNILAEDDNSGLLSRAGNVFRRVYTAVTGATSGFFEDQVEDIQHIIANDLGVNVNDVNGELGRALALHEYGMWRNMHVRPGRAALEPAYKTSYTHPDQPDPGFTFDFAPPESPTTKNGGKKPVVIDLVNMDDEDLSALEPRSSSAPPSPNGINSLSTVLVCARCLEPLVLNSGLTGEEQRKRRVWALRCGHMIDGQCMDLIGSPSEATAPQRRTEASETDVPETDDDVPLSKKWKGKGKAREVEESVAAPDTSIRSRLRSSAHALTSTSPTSSPSQALPEPRAALGKRKRSQASSGSKSRPTEPPREFHWNCPVVGCGRVHVSVKVDGEWIPEPAGGIEALVGKGKGKGRGRGRGAARYAPSPVFGTPGWEANGGEASETATGGRGAIAVFV